MNSGEDHSSNHGLGKIGHRLSGNRVLHGISNKAFTNDEKPSGNGYMNLSALEQDQQTLEHPHHQTSLPAVQSVFTPDLHSVEIHQPHTDSSIAQLKDHRGEDFIHSSCKSSSMAAAAAAVAASSSTNAIPSGCVPGKCRLAVSASNCSGISKSPSKASERRASLSSAFKGIILAFLSSIFFSLTAVIVKYVKDVDAGQMAVARFAGMLLFSFPLAVDAKESKLFGESKSRHWLLLRGLAGATSLYLRYSAFHYLPISNATVIVLSMPVFVCIFGRLFLKESCGIFHVIALSVTLIGIAFTSKLDVIFGSSDEQASLKGIDRQGELYGLMCGMGAALVGSSTYILVRKVKHLPHSTILFNFSWVAMTESLVLTYTVHDGLQLPTDPIVPWLMVLLGVLSFYGQMLLTRALQAEEAALVSVTRSAAEVFFAFVFQVMFFQQIPTWYAIIGAVLVTTSVMLTSMRKWIVTLPTTHWAYRCFWFTLK